MTKTETTRTLKSILLAGAAITVVSGLAERAYADEVEKVTVTGSRLKQRDLQSQSPLATLTSTEAKLQGSTDISTLLNTMPQVFSEFGATVNNGSSNTATVNLRGLGSQRTLVLIDGRRMAPGDPLAPVADLNNIPVGLVDRVEIVTGGASAVYGSDAEGGVVNFIMKQNFEGLQVRGTWSKFYHESNDPFGVAHLQDLKGFPNAPDSIWDGRSQDASIVWGANTADGRGNVTLHAGYLSMLGVTQDKRDYSACSLRSSAAHTFTCSGSANYNFFAVPGSGQYYSIVGGNAVPFAPGAAPAFNFAPYNYTQVPQERYTAGGSAHFEVTKALDIYGSFMFMDGRSQTAVAPSGAFIASPTFAVNCDNPNLTASEVTAFCGGVISPAVVPLYIGRRNIEGGPRTTDTKHDTYRTVVGARGDLDPAWSYDIYGQYAKTNFFQQIGGYLLNSRIADALLVTPGNVCQSGNAGCVPIHGWFQGLGAMTPAELAYLTGGGSEWGSTQERVVSAQVTGDLGEWGWVSPMAKSGVQIALGAEYRDEYLEANFSSELSAGDLAGFGGAPDNTRGNFNVLEEFMEVQIPLIEDRDFFHLLQFNGGLRFSDYSAAGNSVSYKYGGEWAPTADFKFRGSFNRAVRAPNVLELFTPQDVTLFGGQDLCSGAVPIASLANCVLSGMAPAQYGSTSACVSSQCNHLTGGNPNLGVEQSDTKSFGIVLTPRFFKGFSATLDWFDITVNEVIGGAASATVLNACLLSGNASACALFHRDPLTGTIHSPNGYIIATAINGGLLHTEGEDLEMNYKTQFSDLGMGDWGSIGFNLFLTHLEALDSEVITGAQDIDIVGLFDSSAGTPNPEWRHSLRTTWAYDAFQLSLNWRHISEVNNFLASHADGAGNDSTIPAYNYFDLTGVWDINEHFELTAGVINIADKDPPVLDSNRFGISSPPFGNGNTFPGVYDPLGRHVFVSGTVRY